MNCQDRQHSPPTANWCSSAVCPGARKVPPTSTSPTRTAPPCIQLTHASADKQYLGSSFSPSFHQGRGWITAGRTAASRPKGNADVFRILIRDGKVVRKENLTKSEEWDSGPGWGTINL